mmetsp:Transcript_59437/g.88254  ORF Transcript_59437/g.88254 Transcript_59437/m.88254 type:complete len:464 (-) Transcript_59437:401-1792(-)
MSNNEETSDTAEQEGPIVWLAYYCQEAGREYYFEPKRKIATWVMPDSYHPYPESAIKANGGIKDPQDRRQLNVPKITTKVGQRRVSFGSDAPNEGEERGCDFISEYQRSLHLDEVSGKIVQKERGLVFDTSRSIDSIACQNMRPSPLSRRLLVFTVFIVVIFVGGIVIISFPSQRGSMLIDAFLNSIDRHGTINVETLIEAEDHLLNTPKNMSKVNEKIPERTTIEMVDSKECPVSLKSDMKEAQIKPYQNEATSVKTHNIFERKKPTEKDKKMLKDNASTLQTKTQPSHNKAQEMTPNQRTESKGEESETKEMDTKREREGDDSTLLFQLSENNKNRESTEDANHEKRSHSNSHKQLNIIESQPSCSKVQEKIPNQREEAKENIYIASKNTYIVSNKEQGDDNTPPLQSSKHDKNREHTKAATKQYKRCLIPLAYLFSSKCQKQAKENPLFDLQNLVDLLIE